MKWKIVKGSHDRPEHVGTVVVEGRRGWVETDDPNLRYLNEAFLDGTELSVIEGNGQGAVLDVLVGAEDPRYREALRLILPDGHTIREFV